MYRLVHIHEHGKSVLCTDDKFRSETFVGKVLNGRKVVAKLYKNPKRALAVWNAAVEDYAQAEEI